jgi:hypothetical protein
MCLHYQPITIYDHHDDCNMFIVHATGGQPFDENCLDKTICSHVAKLSMFYS